MQHWLGLVIGNSRLHWAWFQDTNLQTAWDTPHLDRKINSIQSLRQILPQQHRQIVDDNLIAVYLASVVASQTALWIDYPLLRCVALTDIPLSNMYSSLGIDRALSLYGAGEIYSYPCLVVDGGTALTFTGVDHKKALVGGAILLGMRSQFQGLYQQTAALPLVNLSDSLPSRWALDTESAIVSGIIYTLVAGIYSYLNDWLSQFPHSSVVFTGGDGELLSQYLRTLYPEIAKTIVVDQKLAFWGLRSLYFI